MDLVLNISISSGRGERIRPVTDLRVNDLYGKMPEEVLAELLERLEGPVNHTYTIIADERPEWED